MIGIFFRTGIVASFLQTMQTGLELLSFCSMSWVTVLRREIPRSYIILSDKRSLANIA
ncbi:MAG: hypothetical protein QGF31_01180 [Nitrospinota bacterium]|nr:hypothetical protein [Nitrospinota bacterium]